jgi:hypothetical protein
MKASPSGASNLCSQDFFGFMENEHLSFSQKPAPDLSSGQVKFSQIHKK